MTGGDISPVYMLSKEQYDVYMKHEDVIIDLHREWKDSINAKEMELTEKIKLARIMSNRLEYLEYMRCIVCGHLMKDHKEVVSSGRELSYDWVCSCASNCGSTYNLKYVRESGKYMYLYQRQSEMGKELALVKDELKACRNMLKEQL